MTAFRIERSMMTMFFFGSLLFSSATLGNAQENPPVAPRPEEKRPEIRWNIPDRPAIPNVEHQVLPSTSMGIDMGYNVYLPPGYKTDTKKRYPVVYFLHGAGGNENADAGAFSGLLTREIEAGHIRPVICVFPNGGMSGYTDHADGKVRMESFLVKELIPQIDKNYRTDARREARAVCGFSMGGGGSIRLALKYPDLFSRAAVWAASIGTGRRGGVDPSDLARQNADKLRGRTQLLIIVGNKDMTYPPHAAFLKTLDELKLPYTYRELPDVDHSLGVYYEKTGEELVRFVTTLGAKD